MLIRQVDLWAVLFSIGLLQALQPRKVYRSYRQTKNRESAWFLRVSEIYLAKQTPEMEVCLKTHFAKATYSEVT